MKDRPDRWQNRAHFCAIAAHSMRQILIERARARGAQKRGGARARVTLDEALARRRRALDRPGRARRGARAARGARSRNRRGWSSFGSSAVSRSRRRPKRWTSPPRPSSVTGRSRARGWRASWRAARRRDARALAAGQRPLPRRARARAGGACGLPARRPRPAIRTCCAKCRPCSAPPRSAGFLETRPGASPPELMFDDAGGRSRGPHASVPTGCSRRSDAAAWASSTPPRTAARPDGRAQGAAARLHAATRRAASGCAAKRAPPPHWRIPRSPRSTRSRRSTASSTSSRSWCAGDAARRAAERSAAAGPARCRPCSRSRMRWRPRTPRASSIAT